MLEWVPNIIICLLLGYLIGSMTAMRKAIEINRSILKRENVLGRMQGAAFLIVCSNKGDYEKGKGGELLCDYLEGCEKELAMLNAQDTDI